MLDCESFSPFDVLFFPHEFPGDPDRMPKLFVVARNIPELAVVRCFKRTSRTEFYDREPDRLKGVVEYRRGQVACLNAERTLISPESYGITYAYIRSCHRNGKFRMVGRLPDTFREQINAAASRKPEWRNAQKQEFARWFNQGR